MIIFTKKYKTLFLLLILVLANLHPMVFGQKVAVVLSGGGSRGAAHVGMLMALEEHNIPVDYIAGTSIGAFVGAMYAAGYSPGEMEQFLTSESIRRWSTGEFSSQYDFFYRRGEPDAAWISLDFDFSKQISKILPASLVSSVEMDFTLMRLFAAASAVASNDFDSLFVPFLCVAADVDANKAKVLRSGDLGRAVRASVSFPFVFKPVTIDGRVLFDGGMYNNFPHEVALEAFGPDLIIGCKVSHNYPSPDPNDIVSQIQKMLMTDMELDLNIEQGIVIEPNLIRPALTDFTQARSLIDSGYAETIRQMPAIKAMISRYRDSLEVAEQRAKFRAQKTPYVIDSIATGNLDHNAAMYVNRLLMHDTQSVKLSDLAPGFYRIASEGYLNLGKPTMVPNPFTGNYILKLETSPADRFKLKFGGNLSSRVANMGFVEMNYKYLFTHGLNLKANVYFGRFYTSVLLGATLEYPSQIPFYLGGRLVYNYFDYFKSTIHFFEDITPSYLIQNENYFRLFGGLPTTPKSKLEAGFSLGITRDQYYQSNIFTREDTADITRFNFGRGGMKWERNTLNRLQYANMGSRFLVQADLLSGRERFTSGSLSVFDGQTEQVNHDWVSLRLVWENYFTRSGRLTLGFYSELFVSNQQLFKNYTSSLLRAAAFTHVPESKTVFLPNFRANNFGVAGLKTVVRLSRNFDFRFENYLFQPYQQILKNEDNTAYLGEKLSDRYWMSSGALVYNTFLGPVSFSVNYFENPEDKFFFALNIGYLIFNQRAIE